MKQKLKLPALLLCVVLLLPLAACGKRQPTPVYPLVLDTDAAAQPADEDAANELPAEPVTDAVGVIVAPGAKSIRPARALKVYKSAVAPIKNDTVGFRRTQWQDFNDITTGEPTGIASRVLTIVSKNVVVHNSAAQAAADPEIIQKGDAPAVIEKFPLFGASVSYTEPENIDFITGAEYIKGDGWKEYYLYFAPELNPISGGNGMGSLMSPFDRNKILDAIKNYVWNVKTDTLRLDCTYAGSYLKFRVDSDGRLLQLEQHMYAQIDAQAEMDLIIASTNFLNGKCLYEEHYTFYDFSY